jgi:hypothetical protein|eukprot:COSAG06_NODE_7113_length_2627_cov_1.848497_3_plen_122_part_00
MSFACCLLSTCVDGGAIPPATTKSHRQLWLEDPKSTQEKYEYLAANKFRGVGIWTAGAVEAVSDYWWGGGCNGDTKIKVCPANATLTAQFAAEMWGVRPPISVTCWPCSHTALASCNAVRF